MCQRLCEDCADYTQLRTRGTVRAQHWERLRILSKIGMRFLHSRRSTDEHFSNMSFPWDCADVNHSWCSTSFFCVLFYEFRTPEDPSSIVHLFPHWLGYNTLPDVAVRDLAHRLGARTWTARNSLKHDIVHLFNRFHGLHNLLHILLFVVQSAWTLLRHATHANAQLCLTAPPPSEWRRSIYSPPLPICSLPPLTSFFLPRTKCGMRRTAQLLLAASRVCATALHLCQLTSW